MTAETPGAGVLGNTRRGLKVFAPTHDSYKNLERVRLLGAKPTELGHLARQAHPNYRAVDHEEASIMHHQRQNFHAARAHKAASEAMAKSEDARREFGWTESGKPIGNQPAHKYGSSFSAEDHLDAYHHHQAEANGYFQSGNRNKAVKHDALADGHLHAFDGIRAGERIKKSLGRLAARAHQAAPKSLTKSDDLKNNRGILLGETTSGKPIHGPYHPINRNAFNGVPVDEMFGKYTRNAHPEYSRQDHREASDLHSAESRRHYNLSLTLSNKGEAHRDEAKTHRNAGEGHSLIADGHLRALLSDAEEKRRYTPKPFFEHVKKSLGTTTSGFKIAPAYSSQLQWVYAGLDPRTGIDDAALAIQAVTPDWTTQDHADHGAAYHELALQFARATPPDDRGPVCAAAAFMHLAACGINPAVEPLIAKSFLVPDPKAKPVDRGQTTAAKYPSMTADDHLRMAKRHLDAGSTKRALMHIQAAHHVGSQKVFKAGRKPMGAAFSHARKVVEARGGGREKKKHVANHYLKQKGYEDMGKSHLSDSRDLGNRQLITLRKATRYEGLSGGDLDNLHEAHHGAKERSKEANKQNTFSDHIIASGMHMYAARLHKQNAPQARDRILYHLKEARRHATQAGGKPATRAYTENKDYLERRHQEFQDRRRKPSAK